MVAGDPILEITSGLGKTRRIPAVLAGNGFVQSARLIYVCFILPPIMKVLPIYVRFYTKIKTLKRKYCDIDKELRYWQSRKGELLRVGERGYRLRVEDLGLSPEQLELLKRLQQQSREVVIAEIDQDGFLLSHYGPIRDAPMIAKEQFLARKRFIVKVVALDGYVGVKKDYKGDKLSFANEVAALHNLGRAGCHVPAIMDVDFEHPTLTVSYILGPVLREELAKRGAILRDRDIDNNPRYAGLAPKERELGCIQEGQRVLYDVVDSRFVEGLFAELGKVHASGFILDDTKYGNIIIEKASGQPYLVDFDYTSDYSNLARNCFTILRDQDIEKFNLHFKTDKLTFKSLRQRIKSRKVPFVSDWYAPVYFGAGLRIGSIWDTEAGYGRWHFILKHHLPPLFGKRILDLGANNAFISTQMLREGAREVIGIERDNRYIAQGNFVRAAFEWADNTRYNFRYIQADMVELPAMDLGEFDMVIALCSLYYLDDDSISNVIRYVSTVTNTFVLQCNTDTSIQRELACTYRKASVEYAVDALRGNGFPVVQVIAPDKYSRPLVIGKKI